MNRKSTLEMTHEEWLHDRNKGIGGSDVATVLGLNKWKSAYQLWLEKTGQVGLEYTESEPAYWGNVLEEIVAKEFQERTGKKVRRQNKVFAHQNYPFLRANIDRDVVGENAILECKTAHFFLGKDWEGEEIPLSYLCQVQHYMNVLNRDYAYIAVLIGGQKFIWKKIERDQELIDLITNQLVEFWETNIVKGVEPAIDGSPATSDFLKQRYSEIDERETLLNQEFEALIESKIQLKQTIKDLEKEVNLIDNRLKSELGKQSASIGIGSQYVVTWKKQERTSLDKKAFEQKYPEVAKDTEIYKTSSYRVLKEKEIE